MQPKMENMCLCLRLLKNSINVVADSRVKNVQVFECFIPNVNT